MHTSYFANETEELALKGDVQHSQNYLSMNGIWKFNRVNDADARFTDFYETGYNDKGWDEIPGSRLVGIE